MNPILGSRKSAATMLAAVALSSCGSRPVPLELPLCSESTAFESVLEVARELSLDCHLHLFGQLPDEFVDSEVVYLQQVSRALLKAPVCAEAVTVERFKVVNHYASTLRGLQAEAGFIDEASESEAEAFLEQIRLQFPELDSWRTRYPRIPALVRELESVPLPILFVPRGGAFESYREATRLDSSRAFDAADEVGQHYARGIYFDSRLKVMSDWVAIYAPKPARGMSSLSVDPNLSLFIHPFSIGKLVAQEKGARWALKSLKRHKAKSPFWARYDVIEPIKKAYWARYSLPGIKSRVDWFFPLADANGAARLERSQADPEHGSYYENGVSSAGFDQWGDRFHRHSALVLPRPRPQGAEDWHNTPKDSGYARSEGYAFAQERVCVPLSVLEAEPHAVVLSKAEGWRPLQEEYLLSANLEMLVGPGLVPDDMLKVVLTTHIRPEPILRILARLAGRDAAPLLEDQELMARLERAHSAIAEVGDQQAE